MVQRAASRVSPPQVPAPRDHDINIVLPESQRDGIRPIPPAAYTTRCICERVLPLRNSPRPARNGVDATATLHHRYRDHLSALPYRLEMSEPRSTATCSRAPRTRRTRRTVGWIPDGSIGHARQSSRRAAFGRSCHRNTRVGEGPHGGHSRRQAGKARPGGVSGETIGPRSSRCVDKVRRCS